MKGRAVIIGVLVICVSCCFLSGKPAWAKYPERKIRFVVPFAAGGGADLVARTMARYVNPYLGGRVYVENVTGAGGAIGFREVAKSTPDGYTVMMLVTSIAIGPHIAKDYPTLDLFDPVCVLVLDPLIQVVKYDSSFKTLGDIISSAKAKPEQISVTTAGPGAIDHLMMAAFTEATGAKFTLVPFKGVNQSMMATVGGHVDVGIGGVSDAMSLVEGKKLRPLVVFDTKRSRIFPEVPTAKELGYNVVTVSFRAVAVPRGTPTEVKNTLVDAFHRAAEDEGFKKSISQMGMELGYLGPEEASSWLKGQNDFFKSMANKVGLKPE